LIQGSILLYLYYILNECDGRDLNPGYQIGNLMS
jgi:hypothetical protein